MIITEEIQKKRQEALAKINKEHGKGSVMSLTEKPEINLNVVPTGSLGLDLALGIGGVPKGRIIEIYGPESSGKTTLAIHIIAEAQKQGGLCAMIDAEHAFDRNYAENLGVNLENLDINQPDSGEEGLQITDELVQSGAYSVIVVDSVAALVPKAELEGEMGENKMGLHARLMGQAMRKLTGSVNRNNVALIFINQLRDKIGVMYGSPETTTGGNALKFYASVRMDVRRSLTSENTVMQNKEKMGNKTTVKVIKNKLAPPFKNAEFNIMYGKGIDKVNEVIELCGDKGILKKWGSQITYNETKYTIQEFGDLLIDNEDFYQELRKRATEI